MEGIYNYPKNKGTILLLSVVIMSALMILGIFYVSYAVVETRISKSENSATNSYYIAEAGINEAIWKLKNDHSASDGDSAWADDFINITDWSSSFSRSYLGGSYSVSIQNTDKGEGNITSTATMPVNGGSVSQRVVKSGVFRAIGDPAARSAIFTSGPSENLQIDMSDVNIYNGNLFSNKNLSLNWYVRVKVFDDPGTETLEGKIMAANVYSICEHPCDSTAESTAICAKNACSQNCEGYSPGVTSCPPDPVYLPAVDFDSSSQYSFKSRAQAAQDAGQCHILCNGSQCSNKCVISLSEYRAFTDQVGRYGTVTFNNEITYVTGSISDASRNNNRSYNIIVNGALVVDGSMEFGNSYLYGNITVNRPSDSSPSGLLAKGKIKIASYICAYSGAMDIEGVIYSTDVVDISPRDCPFFVNITGSIIGRKVNIGYLRISDGLNITYDNDIILYGLGYKVGTQIIAPLYSPVISIDHWEESY